MFINEDTQVKINANLNESVSHSTLRPQDLLPAFLEVIRETPEYAQLIVDNTIPSYAMDDDDADWWDSEDCSYLINEELFSVLEQYAPDGYYFGAHMGNGSDFGYWRHENG